MNTASDDDWSHRAAISHGGGGDCTIYNEDERRWWVGAVGDFKDGMIKQIEE